MKKSFYACLTSLFLALSPYAAGASLTGFNQNWSYLPALDTPGMLDHIRDLRPAMLRYPGGTITHAWDWQQGRPTARNGKAAHPVADIRRLADATGASFSIVLDIVNGTVDDQIRMLRAIEATGVPVGHLELGNEVYAKDPGYIRRFPSGADYAAAVNAWVPSLRQAFPNARIGVVLAGREAGAANARIARWNAAVTRNLRVPVDAWIFHLYISEGDGFEATRDRFQRVLADTDLAGKPLWITEYGNQNSEASPHYLDDLLKLADYVERHPGVEIALNHQIVGAHKNKLTPDGRSLTAEGERFLARGRTAGNKAQRSR